jgi:predicted tellurium resistance membrane protein TerC
MGSLHIWDLQLWASLITLTAMEIVHGIDNLIFIALLAGRLPPARGNAARRLGLAAALGVRLALLSVITLIMRLTAPVLSAFGQAFSWRDLILIGGGLFLVYKGTVEIHERIEGGTDAGAESAKPAGFAATVVQIVLIDVVFSLDSVITAVGMASQLGVMMAAVTISVGVMMVASGPVAGFINRHPTVKMLALSFLLLIGTMLVADGFGAPVPRGYIYAAIAFSAFVEGLNHLARSRRAAARKQGQGADPDPAGSARPLHPVP